VYPGAPGSADLTCVDLRTGAKVRRSLTQAGARKVSIFYKSAID
jgi:hypothetical protein